MSEPIIVDTNETNEVFDPADFDVIWEPIFKGNVIIRFPDFPELEALTIGCDLTDNSESLTIKFLNVYNPNTFETTSQMIEQLGLNMGENLNNGTPSFVTLEFCTPDMSVIESHVFTVSHLDWFGVESVDIQDVNKCSNIVAKFNVVDFEIMSPTDCDCNDCSKECPYRVETTDD